MPRPVLASMCARMLNAVPSHGRRDSCSVSRGIVAECPGFVQERSFNGQAGFWGDIQGTYQLDWDGDGADEVSGSAGKRAPKWY